MLVPGFNSYGGQHYETAPLQQALAYSGLKAPHTGQPYSEDMLFGLGGGLGLAYFSYDFGGRFFIYFSTRFHAEFQRAAIQRLGLPVTVNETSSQKGSEKQLKEWLANGQPVIAWPERSSIPYFAMPPETIKTYHCLLVYGFDEAENRVDVADRPALPMHLTPAELAFSKAAITAQKNRMLVVAAPGDAIDLAAAIREAIQANTKFMLEPPIANFGLKTLPKWADLLTNQKDKKGWPKMLPPGPTLYNSLKSVYEFVFNYAGGGGQFRAMYSRFLDEAAVVMGRPEFKETAAHYCELENAWQNFATAALPESVPLFKETRELLARRDTIFLKEGMAAQPEMAAITARLEEIRQAVDNHFPMNEAEVADLRVDLRDRLLKLQEAEEDGIYQLAALAAKPL